MEEILLGFSYVGNQYGVHKCHFCGSEKSVKYETWVLDPEVCDGAFNVYACNKCVALKISEGMSDRK